MSKQLRTLANSFRVAFCGIRTCIRCERNMRIHLSAALGVTLLSMFYSFSKTQYAVLVLLFAVVIGAEMMNTAVERVVDLQSPNYNHLAKLAKDIAAGAVFVCSLAAVCVGLLFFLELNGIQNLFAFARAHAAVFITGILAYSALAACFIFLPGGRN